MFRKEGKIIISVSSPYTKPDEKDLSEVEKTNLIKAEQELNDRICLELYRKYGVTIRVHF